MPKTKNPKEIPAALAAEPVGTSVVTGTEICGPDVMELGVDDVMLVETEIIERVVLDDPTAVD